RDGDVGAGVSAEAGEVVGVVVAAHPVVQRHDQPVLGGHARRLAHHVAAEGDGLGLGDLPAQRGGVDPGGLGLVEGLGAGVEVGVVGGDGTVRLEVPAAVLQGGDVAGVVTGVDVGDLPEPAGELGPVRAG